MQIFEGALVECFKMGETPQPLWLGFFNTTKGVLYMFQSDSSYHDTQHFSRPLRHPIPSIMMKLAKILDSVAAERDASWSYVGGIARDLHYGTDYNDFDIASDQPDTMINVLREMGLYDIETSGHSRIRAQEYFLNPVDPTDRYPIHFIPTASPFGYAPNDFDLTLNQLSLKSDGQLYAAPKTWHDLEHKIINTDWETLSTTTLMRAIRFATKLDFRLSENVIDLIRKRVEQGPLDTLYFSSQLKKMQEDGVHVASFDFLKSFGIKEVEQFSNFEDCLEHYQTPNLQHVFVEQNTGPGY